MMIVSTPHPAKKDRETPRLLTQLLREFRLLRHGLVLSEIAQNLDEPILNNEGE